MKILGIDPSTASSGYAVMDEDRNLLDYGVIKPNKKKLTIGQQAAMQYNKLSEVIEECGVEAIMCEDQHGGLNKDTLKKLARTSGYMVLLSGQYDLPFELLHPSSWRKVTHGKGNAKKEDTLNWVNETYGLGLTEKENDIADAIGIAYAGVSYFTGENNGDTGNKVS